MKIGLVRRGYSPTGGAENYLLRLADALDTAGHTPVLFAGAEWPRERWPNSRPFIAVPGRTPRAFADALAVLKAQDRCDRLFSLERVWQCDCYRAGDGVHRAWLERRARVEPAWKPLLRRINGKHRQLLALETSLFARGGARRVIANSELVRQEIITHYDTPADRIRVVYNGLPSQAFRLVSDEERASSRAAFSLDSDDYAILFAGTGWERKGLACILAAMQHLPAYLRAVVLVAGRGNPRPYLRSVSSFAKNRVRFLGSIKDMHTLYAAADVFTAPTLYDPFSNACLEALAAGLPVLTTKANGFSEIITPSVHGDVFDSTASTAVGELAALLTGWSDRNRRMSARPQCTSLARTFTIEKNVSETLRILLG